MTEQELKRVCAERGFTSSRIEYAPGKVKFQAVSHDQRRRTVYICQAHRLGEMSEADVVAKLDSKYRVPQPALTINRLPGGHLELLRGPRRKRGATALVLDDNEQSQVAAAIGDDQREVIERLRQDNERLRDEMEYLRSLIPEGAEQQAEEERREARWARQDALERLTVRELRQVAAGHGLRVPAGLVKSKVVRLILREEGHGE